MRILHGELVARQDVVRNRGPRSESSEAGTPPGKGAARVTRTPKRGHARVYSGGGALPTPNEREKTQMYVALRPRTSDADARAW